MPAQGASRAAADVHDDFSALRLENPRLDSVGEPLNLDDIRNALKSLMWRNVGVRRDAEGLAEAEENINHWCALRARAAVRRSRRLGAAEHALRGPVDDPRRAGALREPRRPGAHRFPRAGRRALEPAHHVPAGDGVIRRGIHQEAAKDEG